MTIKQIQEAMELLLQTPQYAVPYIKGKPGVGKSAITKQIAQKKDIAFIDLRLSQLESADIRGIPTPDLELGSSRWLPPETIPFEAFADLNVPGDPKGRKFRDGGILFLDEINRARFDVLQAAFQLVLDRMVGLHKLLDNWFIVCAGNLGEDDHTEVTEFTDAALNDRFAFYYVDEGLFDCWMEWAQSDGRINQDVINYINIKPSALYVDPKEDEEVFATPRSWEKFSRILDQNKARNPMEISRLVGNSILGPTVVGFIDYLKEKKKIKPTDILNDFDKYEKIVETLDRTRKYALSTELSTYIPEHNKMNKKNVENFHRFVTEHLDPDHTVAIFKALVDIDIVYDGKKQEFLDVYLDMFPDMNDKISNYLTGGKDA